MVRLRGRSTKRRNVVGAGVGGGWVWVGVIVTTNVEFLDKRDFRTCYSLVENYWPSISPRVVYLLCF
jgi:hypothetical protein